jgi:AcrR family transcriptional regulator
VGRPNLRLEQGAATRDALVATARSLFGQKGFYGTGTNELVFAAGVTRGALYHHFRDKEALFAAVIRLVARELYDAASAIVAPLEPDRWAQLQAGLQAHLRLIADSRAVQQILLVDGPAVLGWARWRELQSDFSLGALVVVMNDLAGTGVLRSQSPKVAAHLVLAALNEAALLIAHSDDVEDTREDVGDVLQRLVEGLRSSPYAPSTEFPSR